jgi:chromatin segregation and condensation protein Rec8/ScpA/Scc1 (kleisin family)
MVAARRLGALGALVAMALLCGGETVSVGQAERTDEVVERLEELEEDGLLTVQGRTPQQVLEGLLAAAQAHDLTNQKAMAMMTRNIESGRVSVEKYVDTWSKALSKALDRAQKRRKERHQERRAEKQRAKVRQG